MIKYRRIKDNLSVNSPLLREKNEKTESDGFYPQDLERMAGDYFFHSFCNNTCQIKPGGLELGADRFDESDHTGRRFDIRKQNSV